jgi:hypothetical protein
MRMHDAACFFTRNALLSAEEQMIRYLALVALAILAPAFCAADAPVEKPVVAQTLESFETEAATVREGMQPGGAYGYIKPADKERVDAGLEHMQKMLQDHSGQPELSREDKVALLNAQEEVNAILLQNDNNRLICERAAPTGSRIKVTSCHTHGELAAREKHDQDLLSDRQAQPQTRRQGQ